MGMNTSTWHAALALAALCAGCHSPASVTPPPQQPAKLTATVTHPAAMSDGEDAVWSVTWSGGEDPVTISYEMGGGAAPDTFAGSPATNPGTHNFTMINKSAAPAAYTYRIIVTSSDEQSVTLTSTYTVAAAAPIPNDEATVSASYDEARQRITATVSDPEGDPVTISATATGTLAMQPAETVLIEPFPASTAFTVVWPDILSTESGQAVIHVTDGRPGHNGSEFTVGVSRDEQVVLSHDTLYAIPLVASTTAGVPVRVAVMAGAPANKLLYVNGIRLTVGEQSGATAGTISLPGESFDLGLPDATPDVGGWAPIDGIWSQLGISGSLLAGHVGAGILASGRRGFDFNVTPTAGTESGTASGALFNFELTFSTPGVYTLGFQRNDTVKRTYYSGEDDVEHYWGTLMADEYGILAPGISLGNTITVAP